MTKRDAHSPPRRPPTGPGEGAHPPTGDRPNAKRPMPATTRPGLTRPGKRRRTEGEATAVLGALDPEARSVAAPDLPAATAVDLGPAPHGAASAGKEGLAPDPLGASALRVPVALLSLPGERPFDARNARRVGRHLLGDVLGEGGMGRVHAARDVDLGRQVALKTLHPEHDRDEAYLRALVFEARLTGQLEHPNIVPVYDLGVLPDGAPYYTMKLVGELSLRDVLLQLRDGNPFAQRTYTLPRLLQYFRGICMALEYAHARGVIHRDLKPDNVLIGDYGEVQIMDWGVARVLPHDGRPPFFAGRVEEPGVVIGTPHYMSPEQARGDTHLVDVKSDVYALGVILYQILTYNLPYDALNTIEQIDALLSVPIPAPRERAPGREVPAELERICMRALAFRRDDRYPSVRALWDDVEAFLEGRKEEERLAALADAQLAVADAAAERYLRVGAELHELAELVRQSDQASGYLDPFSERSRAQDARLRLQHRELVEARTFAEAVAGYLQVLAHRPSHHDARRRLAELYRGRAALMQQRGDAAGYVLNRDLERAILGPLASRDLGTLHVRSYPEGARLRLYDLEDDGDLDERDAFDLGDAPAVDIPLPPGSYLVSATLPSHQEARVPIVVGPGETEHVLLVLTPWHLAVPMVARADELAAIKEAYSAAVADQRLASLMVCGGPGLGKGKLLAEFGAWLDAMPDLVAFGVVRCDPTYRHVPLQAVSEFLAHRAGVARRDPPAVIHARIGDAVRRAFAPDSRELVAAERAEADTVARRIASLPTLCGRASNEDPVDQSLSSAAYARLVFDAVATFLRRLAERAPIVLAIRGAEHLDRLSRDLLFHLAVRLADRPVFALMFSREDALQLRCDQTLALAPLDPDRIERQVALLLRGRVAAEVLDLLSEESGGNAFKMAELTRLLLRRGWLTYTQRQWTLTPAARAAPPEDRTLAALLGDALAHISAPARELLSAAAVAGADFWLEPLVEHLGRTLEAEVAELGEVEVITPRPATRFAGTREFSFRHDGVQRLLYERLPPEARALGHRALADWLDRVRSEQLLDVALVARHRRLAGDLEAARPSLDRLAAIAAGWERPEAPDWFAWPDDLSSGLFDDWA